MVVGIPRSSIGVGFVRGFSRLVGSGYYPAGRTRRRDQQQRRTVTGSNRNRARMQHILADQHRHAAVLGIESTHCTTAREIALFIEHPVGGQIGLAVHRDDASVFHVGHRVEEQVVLGLLDKADHQRNSAGQRRQFGQRRCVATHRHVGNRVLETVPGKAQFGEHQDVGALFHRTRHRLAVAFEIRLDIAKRRRDLRKGHAWSTRGITDDIVRFSHVSRSSEPRVCAAAPLYQRRDRAPSRIPTKTRTST